MDVLGSETGALAQEILSAANSGEALARAAERLCAFAGAAGVELTMHASGRIAVVRSGLLENAPQAVRSNVGGVQLMAVVCGAQRDYAHLVDVLTLSLYARFANQSATIDALTGVHNRAALDLRLEAVVQGAAVVMDVDNFKKYNDAYGHLAGDSVLRRVAHAASASLQSPNDFFARFGGEEFVVLLDCTAISQAVSVAERMREAVRSLNIPHSGGNAGRVTVSIGVAVAEHGERARDILARADDELYRAKNCGRDRVCAAGYTSRRANGDDVQIPFLPLTGRDREREILQALLRPGAVVTIAGPAGIGKSRLAFHVACEQAARFDVVATIDAWPMMDLTDLHRKAEQFARPGTLVVLDGCEHVVESAQSVVEHLSNAGACVLLTSRVPTGAANESVVRLGALEADASLTLLRSTALSAGALVSESGLSHSNMLRRSCGVAADLMMSGLQLADVPVVRWQRQSLHGMASDAVASQREFSLLMCAAVTFASGFTLHEAAFVAECDETGVSSQLDALQSAGLLSRAGDRFALAETLRAAIVEDPDLREQRQLCEHRHLLWCKQTFTDFELRYGRVENQLLIDAVAPHSRDVELALHRGLTDPFLTDDALDLVPPMCRYWFALGRNGDIERWANALLDTGRGDDLQRARLFMALARCAVDAERWNDLSVFGEMAISLAGNDNLIRGAAFNYLGIGAKQQNDAARARELFGNSLSAARAAGNRRGEAIAIASLGSVCMDLDVDFPQALAHFEEGVAIIRELGDNVNAVAVESNIVEVLVELGEIERARDVSLRILAESQEFGSPAKRWLALAAHGTLCASQGDVHGLQTTLGALLQLREQNPELPPHRALEVAAMAFNALRRRDDAVIMLLATEWTQIIDGTEPLPVERYHHAKQMQTLRVSAQEREAGVARLRQLSMEQVLDIAAQALTA